MGRGAQASQEWFSAAELAELALPGLPSTKRGVLDVAARESWSEYDGLTRPRQGRGGGVEYHICLVILLAEMRKHEAERLRVAALSIWKGPDRA